MDENLHETVSIGCDIFIEVLKILILESIIRNGILYKPDHRTLGPLGLSSIKDERDRQHQWFTNKLSNRRSPTFPSSILRTSARPNKRQESCREFMLFRSKILDIPSCDFLNCQHDFFEGVEIWGWEIRNVLFDSLMKLAYFLPAMMNIWCYGSFSSLLPKKLRAPFTRERKSFRSIFAPVSGTQKHIVHTGTEGLRIGFCFCSNGNATFPFQNFSSIFTNSSSNNYIHACT